MENSYKAKPATHSDTSFTDETSVTCLKSILLASNRIMPDIKTGDKWPNIDGYMEIQDVDKNILGKFEVQIKTLPQDHNFKLPDLETSFLSYCSKSAMLPVILFGIDNNRDQAYWLHIDKNLLQTLDNWENQKTKTIYFDPKEYISKNNFESIKKWELLISKWRQEGKFYKDLQIGEKNSDFINIHSFLDEYNKLLDGPFNRIKQIFYPDSWKVGFAYHTYSADETAYRCYPIQPDFNDIQIKNVDKQYTLTSRSPNPIEKDPVHHARGEIRFDTFENILRFKYLNHTGNEFFAQEFIISIVDKFKTLTGLETKSEYTLDEINNLKERIKQRDQEVRSISFYIKDFSDSIFPIFEEMLSVLNSKNIQTIKRVYNTNIQENLESNLKILFENLLPAYNQIIKNNFPLLEKELSLFINGSDTIIITKFENIQQYNMIYLKSINKTKVPSVEVVTNDDDSKIFSNLPNWGEDNIIYKGDNYEIIHIHSLNITLIEKDFPMLLYIYAILIARFDNYFVELGFENQKGWYYYDDENPYLFC